MKKTSGVQSKKFSRGQFSADEDSQNSFRMSRWSFLGGKKKIPSHDASSSDNQMYPDHSNEISSNASEVAAEEETLGAECCTRKKKFHLRRISRR